MNSRSKARESYDENLDHRVDHSIRERDFYDKQKERESHVDKFIPKRGREICTSFLARLSTFTATFS